MLTKILKKFGFVPEYEASSEDEITMENQLSSIMTLQVLLAQAESELLAKIDELATARKHHQIYISIAEKATEELQQKYTANLAAAASGLELATAMLDLKDKEIAKQRLLKNAAIALNREPQTIKYFTITAAARAYGFKRTSELVQRLVDLGYAKKIRGKIFVTSGVPVGAVLVPVAGSFTVISERLYELAVVQGRRLEDVKWD